MQLATTWLCTVGNKLKYYTMLPSQRITTLNISIKVDAAVSYPIMNIMAMMRRSDLHLHYF